MQSFDREMNRAVSAVSYTAIKGYHDSLVSAEQQLENPQGDERNHPFG